MNHTDKILSLPSWGLHFYLKELENTQVDCIISDGDKDYEEKKKTTRMVVGSPLFPDLPRTILVLAQKVLYPRKPLGSRQTGMTIPIHKERQNDQEGVPFGWVAKEGLSGEVIFK